MTTPGDSDLRKIIYVLDGVAIVSSVVLAYVLHDLLRPHFDIFKTPPRLNIYALMGAFVLPLWLVFVPVFRLQLVFERMWNTKTIALQLLKHHLAGLCVLSLVLFVTQVVVNRSLVGLFMLCTYVLMITTRSILGIKQVYEWRHGHLQPRVIVAGAPSPTMAQYVNDNAASEMPSLLVGRVAPTDENEIDLGDADLSVLPPLLGGIEELNQLLHDEHVDQVLFFPPLNTTSGASDALRICETVGVQARLALDITHDGPMKPRVVTMAAQPFVAFDALPHLPALRAVKHGFDALAAAVGLLVLSPLFLFVSLGILITMGRPVFFVQERAGIQGRVFRMIKFRTMVKDAAGQKDRLLEKNEMTGPVFKVTDDPRITRLGRFLRRTSIDELPQLVNVLLGTMSLVGPRPLPVEEQQNIYGWHRRRLSVKPGISGLWQVSGRSDIDFEDWMKLDLTYVDEWSLKLDAIILFKTIGAVILKKGAK